MPISPQKLARRRLANVNLRIIRNPAAETWLEFSTPSGVKTAIRLDIMGGPLTRGALMEWAAKWSPPVRQIEEER